MLIARFATALLLFIGFAHAADVCHPKITTPADAAEAKQQLAGMQSLLPNATDRQTVLYLISTTQAHLGDWDDAYRSLQSAVDERPWFDPSGEAALARTQLSDSSAGGREGPRQQSSGACYQALSHDRAAGFDSGRARR